MLLRIFRLAGAALALGLVAGSLAPPSAVGPKADLFSKSVDELLADHYYEEALREQKAPEDFLLFQRLDGGPAPTVEMFREAAERSRELGARTRASAPRLASRSWRYVGPSNIGGRVTDIATDIKKKNTLYVAAASGGIWKSTNAGKSYKPIWKRNRVQSIGALVMGPDGTLWAGTGETNPGGGSLTYGGNGVYKSTNRGKTWKRVGLKDSSTIGRIAVDPKNPRHVLVAVSGNLFNPGGTRGLYETRDGGKTWKRILKGENGTSGAVDVAIDPKNPKNIFVTMWDHIRYPDYRRYTGPGSGIWRSTDGGKNFEELIVGLPPGNDVTGGRIGVAIDPKNPDRVWAVYANDITGKHAAFFISMDGGDTWAAPPQAQATLAASQSVYGWWFGKIFVDPYNTDRVFVTGLILAESTDGGLSFPTLHTQMHVDHHGMAWDPHKKGRVYNGNDGGVYRSEKNGAVGSWIHGPSQPWVQFYQIDVSEQDPSRINGGLQDQGSVRSWGAARGWDQYYGGDGIENVINPKDKNNVFACSQYGSCGRSDDGGNSMSGMDQSSLRYGWLSPIEFAPGSGKEMYWAGSVVHRSTDRGESWSPISPDLGEGAAGREINPLYAAHYGTVQALGLSKDKPKTIYAGTDNKLFWKTTDLGDNWTKLQDKNLPQKWVTDIEVDQKNADVLYATFSGYREGVAKAYVVKSTNGGKDWKDISRGLPSAPVNDSELVGNKLYLSNDVGVFVTDTNRIRWLRVGRGLPLITVNDLRYIDKKDALFAGTFGRGVWKISL
ncbi:MAG: glycosyl hydrolase [Actinomycetota bacterium]|nr:glycosyl hydrolase [Actinomycetota bacterium]